MKRYTADILSDITGLSLIGAALDVLVTGTETRVTLYAADDDGGATVSQPVPNGVAFYVPDGRYDLRARANGKVRLIPTVDMFDGFEQNRRLEAVENGEPGALGSLRADLLKPSGASKVGFRAQGATTTVGLSDLLDRRPTTPQELTGAPDDGSASAHAAFLALSGTNRDMIVPPGTYLIDNSEPRQINFYTGEITFSPGAKLIFTDPTRIGLFFYKGSPRVSGVTATTLVEPTIRQNNAAMLRFDDTTDAVCSDIVIERGAGAGILVLRGTGFRGSNIVIRNTLADGFDFFNSSDFTLSDLLTFNTGDDGLGIVSYADGPQILRGTLSNINVRQSNTRGISFIGASNVTLTGFLVEETQGDGIIVERDDTAVTHTPTGIRIANGIIKRAGQRIVDPSYVGDKFGMKVGQSGTVDVNGVTIIDARRRGFSATSSETNAHLFTDNVRVEGAGDEGFFVYNHRSWTYGSITAVNTRATGIRTLSVDRLIGGERMAIHAPREGTMFRAVWDENNAYQDPGTTIIEDLNGPATAFIYRVDGNGYGSAGRVIWNQAGGHYSEINARHLTIRDSYGPRRDDVSPGAGDIVLSPHDALDRRINDALTADVNVVLPQYGVYHGLEVGVSRFDASGTFSVVFKDPNNGSNVVTTIPPGTAMRATVQWDAELARWRGRGKMPL